MCSYYLIKNSINHNNCKTVILDLYDRVFSQNNIESSADMIQNIPSDKAACEIAWATFDISVINMLTLRMLSKHTELLNIDTAGLIKGFLPTDKNITFPVKRRIYKYATNKKSLIYLDKILSYLKNEGVKVIVTEHALPTVSPAVDHLQFRSDILPVLNKYNVPWFDYTNDSSLTGIQYFADESHLNVKGVLKYNHRLINDLIKANLLPDKRNNISPVLFFVCCQFFV